MAANWPVVDACEPGTRTGPDTGLSVWVAGPLKVTGDKPANQPTCSFVTDASQARSGTSRQLTPLLPICENLCKQWMTSSVPVKREIGEEIDPQITQIRERREVSVRLEESQTSGCLRDAAGLVLSKSLTSERTSCAGGLPGGWHVPDDFAEGRGSAAFTTPFEGSGCATRPLVSSDPGRGHSH